MSQLSITDIIKLAKISIPLSANYEAEGNLFGERLATTDPVTIAIVLDALIWKYTAVITPEVKAIGYITVDDVGDNGDEIQVFVNDPILGVISLGVYVKQSFDTDVDILAANIALVLDSNNYGYDVSASGNVIEIIARPGLGTTINGGDHLIVDITPVGDYLTTEMYDPILTEDLNAIVLEIDTIGDNRILTQDGNKILTESLNNIITQ